jgi:hypothetical protein
MPKALDVTFNAKQALAFRYLLDHSIKTIVYGGGGGAGKSWLAAFWLWYLMNSYKGLRFAVCRKIQEDASKTFTGTFVKVVNSYGDKISRYHVTKGGIVNLKTGSEIIYLSLITIPSDAEFDRLGSYELTGVVLEEAQELDRQAYNVIKTRVGRQHNLEYGLTPKVLMTCNPGKNFILTDFYRVRNDPWFNIKNKVVLATHKDNLNYLPSDYIEQLKDIQDPIVRARIADGSWEFGDLQENTVIPMSLIWPSLGTPPEDGAISMGIDVGGFQGYSDKTIVQLISGNVILEPIVIDSKTYTGPAFGYDKWLGDKLIELILSYNVQPKKCRLDASGIGQPIYAYIRNEGFFIYAFRGDAKPFTRKFNHNKYLNLRTQSYYELKEKFRLQKLRLPENYNEQLVEELTAVRYSASGDKLALEDKRFTRRRLGRSPDFADALAMAALDIGSETTERKPEAAGNVEIQTSVLNNSL